jgi:hypothetical protein
MARFQGYRWRLGPHSATWSLRFWVRGEGGVGKRGRQMAGKQHRVCIGDYPAMTLHTARATANTYLGQAKHGISAVKALEAGARVAVSRSPTWVPYSWRTTFACAA